MIAMAIANDPDLLIADEPTTALDVTIQARDPRSARRPAAPARHGLIFITHDLGIVRRIADRVYVMQCGRGGGGGRRPKTVFAAAAAIPIRECPARGRADGPQGPAAATARRRFSTAATSASPSRLAAASSGAPVLICGPSIGVSLGLRRRRRPSASSANRAPANRRLARALLRLCRQRRRDPFRRPRHLQLDRHAMRPLRRSNADRASRIPSARCRRA